MPRPIQASIDMKALAHNLQIARNMTSARIMAVIKANGYGHGLLRSAEALASADGFALLDIQDAIQLREAGFRQTILLLEGIFTFDDLAAIREYNLACVIHSPWQLAMLDIFPAAGQLEVWLKINTGMNRLGFSPRIAGQVVEQLRRHRAIKSMTIMTHFANADEAAGVADQFAKFNEFATAFQLPRSLANSAALLRYPETHGDWVRPGVMLYGSSPFANVTASQLGLKPVMTLTSRIIAVQELLYGDTVGYGSVFCAERKMRIGIVACGYADGYPRHAPTGTPVLVDGELTQTLGRISMDMLVVDLTHIPQAGVASQVVLWGEGLSIDDVARTAGTISYELMCAVATRVLMKSK